MSGEKNGAPSHLSVWPLYLATFLATYTIAVVGISVPSLQQSLGISGAQSTLVVGAYSVTFAAGLIVCGRLGDRFGRKRLFRIGLAALVVTSVLAACAPNLLLLVIGRLLQGCAAAMMSPQILSTIQSTLSGRMRVSAVALYSMSAGTGTLGGQVLGGLINDLVPVHLGWRAGLMSIAVVAALAWVGAAFLPESRPARIDGIDVRGSAIVALSLLFLITGLTNAGAIDFGQPELVPIIAAAAPVALAVCGFVALGFHIVARHRRGEPCVLPLTVIAEPGIRIGMTLAVLLFAMLGAFMYNYAILSQEGFGWSPLKSGLAVAVVALAFILTSAFATRLLARFGPGILIAAAVIQAVGLGLLAIFVLTETEPFLAVFQIAGLFIGAGQGLMLGPLVSVVMATVPDDVAGLTGGLIATAQQTGMGLGVATLSSLFVILSPQWTIAGAFGVVACVTIVLSGAFAWSASRLIGLSGR